MSELDGFAADLWRSNHALRHKVVSSRRKRRQVLGRIAHHVVRHCVAVELFDEACRNLATVPGERCTGLLNDGMGGAFLAIGRNGHGTSCA